MDEREDAEVRAVWRGYLDDAVCILMWAIAGCALGVCCSLVVHQPWFVGIFIGLGWACLRASNNVERSMRMMKNAEQSVTRQGPEGG